MAELKIDKEWVRDAVQPTIDRIKAEYIHKSVIEDIRAEINEAYQQSVTSNLYYAEGLERAFEIIDKHISGKENE